MGVTDSWRGLATTGFVSQTVVIPSLPNHLSGALLPYTVEAVQDTLSLCHSMFEEKKHIMPREDELSFC
jgi:hypothetical protein